MELFVKQENRLPHSQLFLILFGLRGMRRHLVAWPTLSSRFHKADLSESFYNGAEEYKRLFSDIEIDVLNRKVVRLVKPF